MFRCFGAALLEATQLMQQFSMEPLKRLSAKRATDEARRGALRLAEQGQRIPIDKAEELIAEHGELVVPEGVTPSQAEDTETSPVATRLVEANDAESNVEHLDSIEPSPATNKPPRASQRHENDQPFWEYQGDVVRLIIEVDTTETVPDVSVIHDLEAALEAYRREHGDSDHTGAA